MKQKSLAKNQAGAISLYVSLFVMAILVLMSLSFASIIRTGHSETVESQLNTQAQYAAETGINDARNRLVGMLDSFNRGLRDDAPKVIEKQPTNPNNPSSLPNNAGFGEILAIDGDRAVVAHTSSTNGRVYFYDWNGTNWVSAGSWQNNHITQGSTYDVDVELVGDCAFVGVPEYGTAGRVYNLHHNGTSWSLGTHYFDTVGYGASISANDKYIAIGNPAANSGDGEVEIFEYYPSSDPTDPCEFNLTNYQASSHLLSGPSGAAGGFGASVALNDLNFLAVGAPDDGAGAFYTYQFDPAVNPTYPYGNWDVPIGSVQGDASVESEFATKVALSNDKFLAVTVNNKPLLTPTGALYIYRYDYNTAISSHEWNRVFEKSDGNWLDADIAINNKYMALGAKDASSGKGQIRVFEYRQGNGWGDHSTTPLAHNELRQESTTPPGNMIIGANNNDEYGVAVDFGRDDTLLVGVSGLDPNNKGGVKVVKVIPDRNFSRDNLLEDLIEANCLSKETDNSATPYKYYLEGTGHVKYSCLSVDLRPDLLYFDKVYNDRSLNVLLRSIEKDDPAYIYQHMEHLDIEWANVNKSSSNFNTTTYPDFPTYSAWRAAGYDASVLRIQATVLDVGCISQDPVACEPMTRNMIEDNTKVFYLYPADGSGALSETWSNLDDGEIIQVDCGSDNCIFSIQGIPKFVGTDNRPNEEVALFLRVTSIYETSSLSFKGFNQDFSRPPGIFSSNPAITCRPHPPTQEEDCRVEFKDVQAIIGATGHAGHVRVRLEERIRLQSIYDQPEYAIHSASSLCKILIGDQDLGTTVGTLDYQLLINNSNPFPTGFDPNKHCRAY